MGEDYDETFEWASATALKITGNNSIIEIDEIVKLNQIALQHHFNVVVVSDS